MTRPDADVDKRRADVKWRGTSLDRPLQTSCRDGTGYEDSLPKEIISKKRIKQVDDLISVCYFDFRRYHTTGNAKTDAQIGLGLSQSW